jgi:hypothetical protein
MRDKRKSESAWHASTVDQVAKFLGLARRQVDNYLARGAPGKTIDGYDLSAMVAWCKENIWLPKATSAKADLETEKLKNDVAASRIKVLKEAGLVITREAATAAMEQAFNVVRTKLEGLGDELATTVPPEHRDEVRRSVKHRVSIMLREMSQAGDEIAENAQ